MSKPMDTHASELTKILSGGAIRSDLKTIEEFSHGWWPVEWKWLGQGKLPHLSSCVVKPIDMEEVRLLVQWANRSRVPLIPVGGRSGIVGGTCPEEGGVHVDLTALVDFDFNETDLTATVGAGWFGPALEEKLNGLGFTLGHFPQSFHLSTVGGWVATRAIGTFSGKYGKMEDIVTALEVVMPDGSVLRTNPSPKTSAGPAVRELFLGAEGTMGIVTRASLKVHRLPESRRFQVFTFVSVKEGLEAVRRIVQSQGSPAVVRLYDPAEGAPRLKAHGITESRVLLILMHDGGHEFVELAMRKAGEECLKHGGRVETDKMGQHWFETRYNYKWLEDTNRRPGEVADAIEVAAPWSRINAVHHAMEKAVAPLAHTVHIHFSHFYHTEASMYLIFQAKASDDVLAVPLYNRLLEAALDACIREGGSISHHHGVGIAKRRWMKDEHQGGLEWLRRIKSAVDPLNIMNPGKLGLGEK